MQAYEAHQLIRLLPRDRTPFHYERDFYAPQLLGHVIGEGRPIRELRNGPWAPLLRKPLMQPILHAAGDGVLRPEHLAQLWSHVERAYVLTVGTWGQGEDRDYAQVSREGCNLVLQLNFTHAHDREYQRLLKPLQWWSPNASAHPVLRPGDRPYFRNTLAWARLDVDASRGEVLIEEIQSDWVRHIHHVRDLVAKGREDELRGDFEGRKIVQPNGIERYTALLQRYAVDWDQAMLAAAIDFACKELGAHTVWYHSWETGLSLKRIDKRWGTPPRSLYTRLPRQFCFAPVDELPMFLKRRSTRRELARAGISKPRFFKMELQ